MNIATEKSLIVGAVSPQGVTIDVGAGVVVVNVANDGTRHSVSFEANEVVGLGVALIQAGGHAAMMAQQRDKAASMNGKLVGVPKQ